MTFAESRRDNFATVFLQADHFAVAGVYYPAAGGAGRPVRVLRQETQERRVVGQSIQQIAVLAVTIGNDPASDAGGVAEPLDGDGLELDESPGVRWRYSGRVLARTAHSWRLEFHRAGRVQVGVNTTRLQ